MECTEWKNDPGASAPPIRRAPHELIHGTGEMADLTRAFDWSETPVGPIEEWPDTLLITVNTLLASRFPMFLWWGARDLANYRPRDRGCDDTWRGQLA
jgi:hypothetical protein